MKRGRRRFRHDVFISYSHRNADWVRGWLVPRLQGSRLKVCIDHESFAPGAPSIVEMERAVVESRKTALILTPEYVASEWTTFENIMVQTSDPAARERRTIPILLVRCELPLRIASLTYLDFTDANDQEGTLQRLVAAIRPGRARSIGRQARILRPRAFEVPTGALTPESSICIEREPDGRVQEQVTRQGTTAVIRGARQTGKSSPRAGTVRRSARSCGPRRMAGPAPGRVRVEPDRANSNSPAPWASGPGAGPPFSRRQR